MAYYRTPKSIKAYNWFKLVSTLSLLCIFVILLFGAQREAATSPVGAPEATATVQIMPTPQPPEPTTVAPMPEQEADAPAMPVSAPVMSAPQVSADGTMTFSGTGTPGSVVEISSGEERLGQVTVSEEGVWTFIASLDPGEYTFSARAIDAFGATLAESPAFQFAVLALKESPTLTSPLSGTLVAGNMVKLEGAGTPGMEIEILDQGQVVSATIVQPDGTWTLDYLSDSGARSLTVRNAGKPDSASEAIIIEVATASISIPDDIVCGAENVPVGIDRGTVYIVAPCEYLGLIAVRAGVSLADLMAANPQLTEPDRIYPGQILNLPSR